MEDNLRRFRKRPAEALLPHLVPGTVIQYTLGGRHLKRILARIEWVHGGYVRFLSRDPATNELGPTEWPISGFTDYAWALRDEADWILQEIAS